MTRISTNSILSFIRDDLQGYTPQGKPVVVSRDLIEFIELRLLTVGTKVGRKRKAAGRRDTCRQIKKDEFTQ
jgi:hypothetical protein